MRIFGVIIFVASAAVAFARCAAPTDYSAIQTYASTTAQSADSFAALAADFAASCERYRSVVQGLIEPAASGKGSPTIISRSPGLGAFLISQASSDPGYQLAEPAQLTVPAAASASSGPPARSVPGCSDAKSVSAAWTDANSAVLSYVQSLGSLAGVDAVPTVNPSPFVAGLTQAGVSSAATQAVSGLMTTISSFFINQARERQINQFLAAVNPYMPGAIGALETTDASYTIELQSEYNMTVIRYNAFARQEFAAAAGHGANYAVSQRLARTKGSVETSLLSINQRLRASAAYGKAVAGILATHQDLYAASQRRASLADYLKIVQTTGAPVIANLSALAKAVK